MCKSHQVPQEHNHIRLGNTCSARALCTAPDSLDIMMWRHVSCMRPAQENEVEPPPQHAAPLVV